MKDYFETKKDVMFDTSAMGKLYLYVDICDKIKIDLDQDSFDGVKKILLKHLRTPEQEKAILFKELKVAYKIYQNLIELNHSDTFDSTFYFSKLAKLELNHLCLENRYHQDLAESYIPYRIRDKFPFKSTNISPKYLTEIYTTGVTDYIKKIEGLLSDKGIDFILIDEDSNVMTQTIDMVTTIFNKYIHLQSNDLYLYCLTVFSMSNYFYVFDKEIEKVAKNLRTNDDYNIYRDEIVNELCSCISLGKFYFDENGNHNVIFPEPVREISL